MGQFLVINTNYVSAVLNGRNSAIVCKYVFFFLEISGQPTCVCLDFLFPTVATALVLKIELE